MVEYQKNDIEQHKRMIQRNKAKGKKPGTIKYLGVFWIVAGFSGLGEALSNFNFNAFTFLDILTVISSIFGIVAGYGIFKFKLWGWRLIMVVWALSSVLFSIFIILFVVETGSFLLGAFFWIIGVGLSSYISYHLYLNKGYFMDSKDIKVKLRRLFKIILQLRLPSREIRVDPRLDNLDIL